MKRRVCVRGLFGAAVLAAAAASQQKYDVEVVLREKRIAEPSVSGYTYAFHLALKNLTDKAQFLVRYDHRVVIGEVEYLRLETVLDEPIRLDPGGDTTVALPVRMNPEHLFPAVPGLEKKDTEVCYVSGGMTFRDERRREKRVPMAFSGEFPVYRGFEGGVGPVEVKTLTLGGAEVAMTVLFRNLNGFPVDLKRLAYKLELVGRTVAEGVFSEEKALPLRGEVGFAVPLILDFFETGRAVYDGLEQPPLAVRVTGEAEVATPWGPWKIPVAKSDKVAVMRKNGGHEPNSREFGSCPRGAQNQ